MRRMVRTALCGTVLLASTGAITDGQQPSEERLTGRLYVSSWFGGVVSVVDLATTSLRQTIQVGVQNHNVFLSPDRRTAWVTNNNDGTVTILDTASDAVRATVNVGAGPRHTNFSPDGAEAYVTAEFDNAVAVVDGRTRFWTGSPSVTCHTSRSSSATSCS